MRIGLQPMMRIFLIVVASLCIASLHAEDPSISPPRSTESLRPSFSTRAPTTRSFGPMPPQHLGVTNLMGGYRVFRKTTEPCVISLGKSTGRLCSALVRCSQLCRCARGWNHRVANATEQYSATGRRNRRGGIAGRAAQGRGNVDENPAACRFLPSSFRGARQTARNDGDKY